MASLCVSFLQMSIMFNKRWIFFSYRGQNNGIFLDMNCSVDLFVLKFILNLKTSISRFPFRQTSKIADNFIIKPHTSCNFMNFRSYKMPIFNSKILLPLQKFFQNSDTLLEPKMPSLFSAFAIFYLKCGSVCIRFKFLIIFLL